MKVIAGILLLLNILAAAYFVGQPYWQRMDTQTSVERAPLHVEKLTLQGQAARALMPVTTSPKSAPSQTLCVEWRGLGADFTRVREQLKQLTTEQVMSFTEAPEQTRHWVIFPPLPSAESANLKLSELLASGLTDAFVVKDGVWRYALSLGLYANDETARRRIREVEEKGVLGTRVELLPRQGTPFYFVVKSDDDDVLKNLSALKQAYPNSYLSRIACPS
ncbi:MAG: hypothetical protein ABL877_11600 [Thiobacillus sp.]